MAKRAPEISDEHAKKRCDVRDLLVKGVPQPEASPPRGGGKELKGRFAGRVARPVSIKQMGDA